MTSLQIYWFAWWWKHFESRSAFGEVIFKSVVAAYLTHTGPVIFSHLVCFPDDGEPADVAVAYDSEDVDEVGPDGGRRSKSGRLRRRRSSVASSVASSAASYRSVDHRPQRLDPSLRCVSVGSATTVFVHLTLFLHVSLRYGTVCLILLFLQELLIHLKTV